MVLGLEQVVLLILEMNVDLYVDSSLFLVFPCLARILLLHVHRVEFKGCCVTLQENWFLFNQTNIRKSIDITRVSYWEEMV